VAGSSGVAARRLLPYSAASALVWTATFIVLGYAFSGSFAAAGETATRIGLVGLLLVLVVLIVRSRWGRGRPPATHGAAGPATGGRRAA
jgi:membrane protein DedA with SNARE-associated domain